MVGQELRSRRGKKTNDPFLKPGRHQNMPRSLRLCTSIRKDWPEGLPSDNVIGNEGNGLSRYSNFLAGSGPPSTSFCSTTDSKHIEEFPVRNYKNLNVALVSPPTHSSKQPQRNQLAIESKYTSLRREIAPKVEEQIPLRLSKGLKGIESEFWGLKSPSRTDVNRGAQKVFANISNVDKTITSSSNAHLIRSITPSTSSTNNYPQLIVEKTVKGKGVICKDLDKSFSLGGTLMRQEDEKPGTLLRSNVNDNMHSLQGIVTSGTGSFCDGLNLREWMKSEGHKMKKSERLCIFKQILESVDLAHSQGVVLHDLRPSCFTLLPSNKIKYIGSYGQQVLDNKVMNCNVTRKRPWEQDICASQGLSTKQQKLCEETTSLRQQQQHHFTCIHGCRTTTVNQTDSGTKRPMESRSEESPCQDGCSCQHASVTIQLEEKWYCSPEMLNDGVCTFSSNIYSLGVLLFEVSKYFGSHNVYFTKLCLVVFPLGSQNILLNFIN